MNNNSNENTKSKLDGYHPVADVDSSDVPFSTTCIMCKTTWTVQASDSPNSGLSYKTDMEDNYTAVFCSCDNLVATIRNG